MAQDIYASIEGTVVSITNLSGAFRKCPHCGGERARVSTAPEGFHHGRLTCTGCARRTSYLSREHLAALLAAHSSGAA